MEFMLCPLCDTYVRTESCLTCEEIACENCGNDWTEIQHRTEYVRLECEA